MQIQNNNRNQEHFITLFSLTLQMQYCRLLYTELSRSLGRWNDRAYRLDSSPLPLSRLSLAHILAASSHRARIRPERGDRPALLSAQRLRLALLPFPTLPSLALSPPLSRPLSSLALPTAPFRETDLCPPVPCPRWLESVAAGVDGPGAATGTVGTIGATGLEGSTVSGTSLHPSPHGTTTTTTVRHSTHFPLTKLQWHVVSNFGP